MHQPQGTRKPTQSQFTLQLFQVGAHQRLHEGIGSRGYTALVFGDLGHHGAGQRQRQLRELARSQFRHHLLVNRVAVGVQETHGHRVDASSLELSQPRTHLGQFQCLDHPALAIQALGHFQSLIARDQWLRKLQEQIIDVVALLSTHLKNVSKARGGEQAHACATLALDDGVGHQRGAMDDVVHLGEGDPSLVDQLLQTDQRRARWVVGRGQPLVQENTPGLPVKQHEVGECSANVESDAPALCHDVCRVY